MGYKEALGEGWVKERMRYEVDQSVQSVLAVLAVQALPSRVDFIINQNLPSLPKLLWRVTLSVKEAYDR